MSQTSGTKNIVISGTSFWNPGDDFVREGVIAILKNLFSGVSLNFFFYNFNADFLSHEKSAGIANTVANGDLRECGDHMDAVVIAGLSAGGEIRDLYNWIIESGLQDRVYLIGAGYENDYVADHISREPEATIFRHARIITGRTAKRPTFIDKLGLPYHHVPCPAILSVKRTKSITAEQGIRKIGFSIQLPHEQGIVNQCCSDSNYRLSLEMLLHLAGSHEVEIIAHHKSEYFHFLKLLAGTRIPIHFSSFYHDLHDIYRGLDLVVTTRLHASLFANGHGIPGIIINDTDRHTHCLEGFPHSVCVNSRDSFNVAFKAISHADLRGIAIEAERFKSQLMQNYVALLEPAFKQLKVTRERALVESSDPYCFDSEKNEQKLVRRHVRKGMTVFDVGANIGKYTKLFSYLTGEGGRVFAFEPSEGAYHKLREGVLSMGATNVTCLRKAAFSENASLQFNEFPERYSSWNSLGRPAMEDPEDPSRLVPLVRSVNVEAVTIDSFCEERGIDTIDYLKLDVEGAEIFALQGAKRLLERQAIRLLQFEISQKMLEGLRTKAGEVFDYLSSMGYACHAITGNGELGETVTDSDAFYENYIAIPAPTRSRLSDSWENNLSALIRSAVGSSDVKSRVLKLLHQLTPDPYLERNINTFGKALRIGEEWFDSVTFLNWYASVFHPSNYLEVGVRRGRSIAQVLLESPETECYAFDLWIENYAGEPNMGPDFVARELARLGAATLPQFIVGNSHETLPAFWSDPANPRLFDLINIDGDHTYEGAKLDLDLAFEHLAPGGVLLFDDIRHVFHPELWPLWQEYRAKYPDYLFLEDETGNGTACAFRPPFERLQKILAGDMTTVTSDQLPIHFFTIVLNGEPFIRYHIEVFKHLPFKWHWHIVEGVANLFHDTSWCMSNGGRVTEEIHRDGLSNDGTTSFLDELERNYPENVSIYRNPGAFWDGKLEMVNAPLPHISEDCLLWQIDADELWTAEQISTVRTLFLAHPNKTAAYYFCRYFVTPEDLITTHDTYGNYTSYEWLRTWRFTPGSRWFSHEPPRLCRRSAGDTWQDIACIDPFMHNDTDAFGLRFQHFAYATPNQLLFKAIYYGYSGAMASWHLLRQTMEFPVPLKNYFPWVKDDALVDRALTHGVKPLAWQEPDGTWRFGPVDDPSLNKNRKILYVRTDSIGDAILASSMLFYIRDAYQNAHISVLCQEHIAELYEACPYIDEIITFNLKKAETDFTYRDQIVESIRERHFDLALNPVYSRNGLGDHFVMASEIVERIGHQGDLSNLTEKQRETNNANYSKLLPSEGAWRTELERHRDFLAGLDIRVAELNPSVWITPDDFSFAEEFFHANQLDPKRTVALFSGAQHSSRHYLGYGQALSELCIQRGFTVIALGGPEDADLNRNNLADLSVKTIDLSGKTTLRQTAALLSRCCLAIGAETGLAHMACAVDVPNVILLGGGHAGRFIPYSRLTTAVSLPLACFGCNWHCKYVTTYCVRSIDPVSLGKACHVALDTPTDRARVIVQTAATCTIPDDFPMYTDISRFIDPSLADIITLTGDSSMQNTVTNTTDQLQSVKINNRLQEGEEYFSRGDFDSAIDCFNRIVHRYPECSAPAHSNLGVIYWQHGETQISLEHLSSAIKLDPSYRPAVTNSIAVLEQLGAFSAATGICRDFLELHPDDLELQHKMQELGDSGFHQLEENWERFAQADPMWAILTDPAKKGNKWEPGEFFATGIKDIQGLFNYLKGIDISPSLDSALDFGCGVGRITQALAMRFATATGIDIAPSMIREAKRNNRFDVNCRYMLNQRNDLEMFADGTFDFIYSVITLQHIRPLYIRNYLVEFMRVLKPNGILVFQLPSRLYGVPTPLQEIDYAIEPTSKEPRMEMHGIPKEELIEFIEEHGGKAVDIIPDRSLEPAWESYRYCVIKYGS